MAISKLDIFKTAIGKVSGVRISGVDEESNEAKACRDMFEFALNEVLFEHSWSVAISRANLSLLTTPPVHGYTNAFQLPSDFIRLINCYDGTSKDDFDFEWERVGNQIWTDAGTVYVKYVKKLTSIETMNPPLLSALAQRLAYRICYAVNRKDDREGTLLQEYEKLILPRAKAQDSMESRYLEFEENPWVERMRSPEL